MARPRCRIRGDRTVNVAVIDIGTNTVLLLVASFDRQGTITPLRYEQQVPRLGKGIDARGALQPDAMQRVVRVLRDYREMIRPLGVASTVVCATSAARDAANREEFVNLVLRETGFHIEILSGEDEASWTYRGAVSGIPDLGRATVLDIGGGSTEISTGMGGRLLQRASLNIGSVRMTERFFKNDPPLPAEIDAAAQLVRTVLSAVDTRETASSTLIAVAGTATTLALLAQGQTTFSLEAVSGARLGVSEVERLFGMLRDMSSTAIRTLSEVLEGRNDVITAGALILREVMRHFGFTAMIVSERGVRYGLAIREWEKHARAERRDANP